jgi:GAF domain-containing protein
MAQEPLKDILYEFESRLSAAGVHGALRFLNQRTSYRFTGVYRFKPPLMRSLMLYDRENPDLVIGSDTLLTETYCSIVGEIEAPFSTPDARQDERLTAHPARESILSYCGVLLRAEDGATFGTLCHFDLIAHAVMEDEIQILEAAAPLLMPRLLSEQAASAAARVGR